MKIAGINFSNDSAAALVNDGRRVAACAEERFSRRKHDSSFPDQALRYVLSEGGLTAGEVDEFAFFWNPAIHLEPALSRLVATPRHHSEYLYSVPNHLLQLRGQPQVAGTTLELALDRGQPLRVRFVEHHLAHAAAALCNSPFEETAILTVDGYGERTSTSIMHGRGNRLEPVLKVEFPHSVGALYAALTQYLGFKANSGEGKVMGLASYGDDSLWPRMAPLARLTPQGFELDLSYFSFFSERTTRYSPRLVELFGPPRSPESPIEARHENVAAALQRLTEEILLHLARLALARTGSSNLVLAGGVALNCVANRRIMLESGCRNLFILPPAGDAGTSLGAAQYVAHIVHGEPRDPTPYHDYLGPASSPGEIDQALRLSGLCCRELPEIWKVAAALIAQRKIVGWFQGRSEFGPRALGNRSIIADPRPAEMKDILNARVKFREPFRPFAPSCLEESCGELFDCSAPSPFMLRVYNTLPERLNDLAAITHIDGGARVQTVNPDQNRRYYELIREFGRITGVDSILNTSFNIRGEPIVNTAREAIFCFVGTDMDYLIVGDYLVAKNSQSLDSALGVANDG